MYVQFETRYVRIVARAPPKYKWRGATSLNMSARPRCSTDGQSTRADRPHELTTPIFTACRAQRKEGKP